MRPRIASAILLLALTSWSGCLTGSHGGPAAPATGPLTLVDDADAPVRLALVQALAADGTTLWYTSSGLDGKLNLTSAAPMGRFVAWVNGTGRELELDEDHAHMGPAFVAPSGNSTAPNVVGPRHSFENPIFPVQLGTTCTEKTDGDLGCGLDEPSVEVDGRGWIYYTAACCFFVSSPVWVSKDGGATFQPLPNVFKDAYGNEGDLAIDSEGNVYYMDIDLATFGIARWSPDLQAQHGYRRPGQPLVDRPWIRAGTDGRVHAIYNTGYDTVHYLSTDHGLTFGATPTTSFGSGLANAYGDVFRDVVGFVGGGAYMESTDGAGTWGPRTPVEGCDGADVASIDEAGTRWFEGGGCVVGLDAGGNWTRPTNLTPGIKKYMTWVGAGAPGAVAVAYYGQPDDPSLLGLTADQWYLFLSFSTDAGQPDAHWAHMLVDPEPIGHGGLGRSLGDFFQVEVGPDGSIHIAYVVNQEMDDSATASYVRVGPVPGMAPSKPLTGPVEG